VKTVFSWSWPELSRIEGGQIVEDGEIAYLSEL